MKQAKPKRRPGNQPKPYDPKVGDRIRALMSEGKSLKRICRMKSMPTIQTVTTWLRTTPEFADLYTRACGERAAWYADEMVDIADGATEKTHNTRRLRIETRKFIAMKLLPRVYGEQVGREDPMTLDRSPATEIENARAIAFALRVGAEAARRSSGPPLLAGPKPTVTGQQDEDVTL